MDTSDDTLQPIVQRMDEVEPQPIEWLWPGVLPRGKVVILDGDPGLGKSLLAIDLCARLSRGGTWPDGSLCPQGNSLFLPYEDSSRDTIRPRLDAAEANCRNVQCLMGLWDDKDKFWHVKMPEHQGFLADTIHRAKAKLVVIDPLMAFLSVSCNSINDQSVRQAMNPLVLLAEEYNCTILLVRHLNKSGGARALYRGSGSIGIVGAARCSYLVGRNPKDEEQRIFACVKHNCGPLPVSLAFRVEGKGTTARVEWLGASALTADDLCGPPPEAGKARTVALQLLHRLLANGPRRVADIYYHAAGENVSRMTLRRVFLEMALVCFRRSRPGVSKGHDYYWCKPDYELGPGEVRVSSPPPEDMDLTATAKQPLTDDEKFQQLVQRMRDEPSPFEPPPFNPPHPNPNCRSGWSIKPDDQPDPEQ